jgi:putative ABC transport system permease protein
MIDKRIGQVLKDRNEAVTYRLQPLKDIHLTSHYMMEAEVNGNGKTVRFLLIIAFFIIIIAWINYINLSTARSLERAREVGVRKVLGSYRLQLIRQFMMESMLINFFAMVLAICIIMVSLPLFNSLTGKEISFSIIIDKNFWLVLGLIFIAGTFFSGIYPAFVLSSFKPIEVLKGRLSKTGHGAYLRQALVILQFAASVALMAGTYSVHRQLKYMKDQDLGVEIAHTLILRGPNVRDSTHDERMNAFKSELLQIAGINVATSTDIPGQKVGWNAGGIYLVGGDPKKNNQYRVIGIDDDFIKTYGLKILKGRAFSSDFTTEKNSVILNEAALQLMGFSKPEQALEKKIEFWGEQYTIVGIVNNHHQESPKQAYDALIFRYMPNSDAFYSLKATAGNGNWEDIIKTAEKKWAAFFPGNPFEYFFLDEHFNKQYKADRQFGATFGLFAILAIIIACLGLFGLVSFVTTQRTKEIGIRKISGAGLGSIMLLLVKDFIKPILIALVIAAPVTWYLLNAWLQDFANKININLWMFVLPAVVILIIALLTISSQTFKVATSNPIKSLRTE